MSKYIIKTETFANTAQYVRTISARETNKYWHNRRRSSQEQGRADWHGTATFADACQLAQSGYTDAVARMRNISNAASKQVNERVAYKRGRAVNSYVGGTPNTVRAMAGLPRDMRRAKRERKPVAGVTIVYDAAASWRTSTDDLIKRGAHLLTLINLLTRQGVPVRLVLAASCRIGATAHVAEVTLKDYGTPCNMAKLAYYVAHPSAFRRLAFAWLETTPIMTAYDDGYGYSMGNTDETRKAMRDYYAARRAHYLNQCQLATVNDVLAAYNNITGTGTA